MKEPRISMIAAIGKNRELGKQDRLLWNLPGETQYFRDTTRGHANVMGRKTFESLLHYFKGKPIPGRTSILVTRDPEYKAPQGTYAFTNIEDALEFAKKEEERLRQIDPSLSPEVFIIGGAQMYALGMPYADRLYLTFVDGEYASADAYFPEFSEFTKVISEKDGEENGLKYKMTVLEKE